MEKQLYNITDDFVSFLKSSKDDIDFGFPTAVIGRDSAYLIAHIVSIICAFDGTRSRILCFFSEDDRALSYFNPMQASIFFDAEARQVFNNDILIFADSVMTRDSYRKYFQLCSIARKLRLILFISVKTSPSFDYVKNSSYVLIFTSMSPLMKSNMNDSSFRDLNKYIYPFESDEYPSSRYPVVFSNRSKFDKTGYLDEHVFSEGIVNSPVSNRSRLNAKNKGRYVDSL